MRIWKYTLQMQDLQTLTIPVGAKLLSLQMQEGKPQLWALVDEASPCEPRRITVYGTGQPIHNDPGVFIGTFQYGEYVFHVFEVEK